MKDTKPVFDSSRAGDRVRGQRHDQPGDEWNCYMEKTDYDTGVGDKARQKPSHVREDRGHRSGEDLPTAEQQLREADDPGKVYNRAEIDALYPDGYAPGVPSIHPIEGSYYRFPEARPKRICG